MTNRSRRTALPAAAFLLLVLATGANRALPDAVPDPDTTILIVRHAEKADGGNGDPALSPAGEQRARDLLDAVRQAKIAAVYTTQFQRTRQTAQPVAEHFGVPITVIEARGGNAREGAMQVANRVLSERRGESVLIVGHSNTVPAMVEAFGGTAVPAIADGEYDNLYVVVVPEAGATRVVRARYGAASAR